MKALVRKSPVGSRKSEVGSRNVCPVPTSDVVGRSRLCRTKSDFPFPTSIRWSPRRLFIPVLVLILVLLPQSLPAQDTLQPAPPRRPKVGLALSGGGAKGFVHIGVLKVLEEAGIRPDYIAGTSMGSIVGGLYALGYSADSLERIALTQNWDRILTDELPLREVIFEEKPFFKNQLIELPIVGGKIVAPSGLIQGQQIEHMLARLMLPSYRITEFDSLPIPFHCVAVDLYWGVPVELSSGSLPRAIRASMAIPSVFPPVVIDSLILVDGGLVRNFPVQEVRRMGADYIIGIHCGPRQPPREDLAGLSGVLAQSLFLGSVQDSEHQFTDVNLYIEPVVAPYGPPDFSRADTLIARGERAAREWLDELRHFADSIDLLGPPPPLPQLPYPDTIRIDRIEVVGNRRFSSEEILGRGDLSGGRTLAPRELDRAVNDLMGTNYFTKVTYELHEEGEQTVLQLNVVEKARALIRASLLYDSYHQAGISFNLVLRNILDRSSRFMLVGQLSTNYRYRLSYLRYLDREQRWFAEGMLQYNRDELPLIQNGRITETLKLQDFPIDLLIHRRLNKNTLIGLGSRLEFLSLRPTVSENPDFDRLRYSNLNLVGVFQINSLDRNILPRRGSRLLLEMKHTTNLGIQAQNQRPDLPDADSLYAFDPYPKLTFHSDIYIPLSLHSSLQLSPFAGVLWSAETAYSDFYLLGGPRATSRRAIPFHGLDPNELVAQVALGASLGYQYFLSNNLMFGANLSTGFIAEPEVDQIDRDLPVPDQFLMGAGLTAAYNSLVGPIQITLMQPFNTGGIVRDKLKVFLTFGHRF